MNTVNTNTTTTPATNTTPLQLFTNSQFGNLRTLTIDNEPWFVGKDVATALGYKDTKDALQRHVADEDKIMGRGNTAPSVTDNLGRIQYPVWINESGLYSLILSSKLPTAKQFKHWVTAEVLPAIRKTGGYIAELLLLMENLGLLVKMLQVRWDIMMRQKQSGITLKKKIKLWGSKMAPYPLQTI